MPVAPKRSSSRTSSASADDREAMYDISLRASERAVDVQRDELSGIRTRSVAFAAFTGAGTAFLVGAGLTNAVRTEWFYVLAIVGTGAYVAMLVFLILATFPSWSFRFYLESKKLETWIDGDPPAPSRVVFVRKLVGEVFADMIADNKKSLKLIRVFYRCLLVFGALGTLTWTTAVWLFA